MEFLTNMLLAMMLIGIFNLIRGLLRMRKLLKQYKDDPNIEGITIVNGQVKIIQKQGTQSQEQPQPKELVEDEICHQSIEKEKAYRVLKDGKEHFFCSWECRQKFLEKSE